MTAPPGYGSPPVKPAPLKPTVQSQSQTVGTGSPGSFGSSSYSIPRDTSGNIDWGSLAGDVWGLLGKGASGIVDNAGNIALGGLAAVQAANAAKASARAGTLGDQAIQVATDRWNQGAPIRNAGANGLIHPSRVNLSSVTYDRTNPFASRGPAPTAGDPNITGPTGSPDPRYPKTPTDKNGNPVLPNGNPVPTPGTGKPPAWWEATGTGPTPNVYTDAPRINTVPPTTLSDPTQRTRY